MNRVWTLLLVGLLLFSVMEHLKFNLTEKMLNAISPTIAVNGGSPKDTSVKPDTNQERQQPIATNGGSPKDTGVKPDANQERQQPIATNGGPSKDTGVKPDTNQERQQPIAANGGSPVAVNGGFRKDTSGWIAYQTALSVSPAGQDGNCLKITTTGNATGYAYFVAPTKVGETYKFTGYYKRGSADNGQIKIGNTVDNPGIYYSGVLSDIKWRKLECVFKASSNTTYITLVDLTSVKGKTSFFDSISLTEIR